MLQLSIPDVQRLAVKVKPPGQQQSAALHGQGHTL